MTSSRTVLFGAYTYDAWVDNQWIGMAIGDTPSEARESLLSDRQSMRWKNIVLTPFYGLNTSQTTLEHLMGVIITQKAQGAIEADPAFHGVRSYDAWIDQQHVETIAGNSPADVRRKSKALWPKIFPDRIHLLPNYGSRFDAFSVYSTLTGQPAKILKSA